jgi:uncharacterized protein (TIGR02300 family)
LRRPARPAGGHGVAAVCTTFGRHRDSIAACRPGPKILLLTGPPDHGIGSANSSGDQGEYDVAKPEWGVKRNCTGCGARFYDLRRDPIVCPKCEAVVDPLAMLRSQRTKAPAPAPVKKPVVAKVEAAELEIDGDALVDDEVDDDIDLEEDSELEADAEEDTVMEDTSELGEDKDDMFEVIEKVGEEGGEEGAR